MNSLLPPSTNQHYAGSQSSAWFLALLGFGWCVGGSIHSFAPDGGAGTIAGIDLSQGGQRIIALFAWAGATQLAHGITMIVVALRYRSLVPLLLVLSLMERALLSWSAFVSHIPASGEHPPGQYGSLIAVPLILFFLWLSLRNVTTAHSTSDRSL